MSPAVEIAVRNSAGLPGAFWAWMAVFSVLLGACIGSFLNVCICRIPLGQSVVRPRSHCMSCGSLIPWYHNIPVLSYFALRGKCAKCGAPFSFRYAGIELLTAFLFLAVFCLYPPAGAHAPLGFTPLFGPDASVEEVVRAFRIVPVYWLFVSGLLVGTFIDFDHFILPDSVTLLDYEGNAADATEAEDILHASYTDTSAAAHGIYVQAAQDFTAEFVYTAPDGTELSRSLEVKVSDGGTNPIVTAKSGISTYHIEQAEELRAEDFAGKGRVGLTAGASTPRKLIDATQQWLEQLPD